MKKRILSLILALSMVLSVLPLGAFAAGSTQDLVIGSDGYPVGSEGGSKDCNGGGNGNDWEYYSKSRILCLNGGTFDLSTTEPVKCEIHSFATITDGTFNGAVYNLTETISGGIFNGTVTNDPTGKISGGTFAGSVENQGTIKNGSFEGKVTNNGTITGTGTFNGEVTNNAQGTISGGTFQSTGSVENSGTIEKGTFEGQVTNDSNGKISGGTFQSTGSVTNEGTITGNGTFNGTVTNSRYIENGTFNGTVTNSRYIKNGTFNGTVTNNDAIFGGIFAGSVNNSEGCNIYGGVFNGKTGLDGVTVLISITWDAAYPNAKITEVNGVSADWKPYVVVTSFTETREVIITADTEIFSLNGYPIDGSPYSSSYPDTTDKKTVKFTELGVLDYEVVLNGAITHGGDLVMENGYPKASIGGKYSCTGNGWEYDSSGKLILTSGTYDFSSTHPQGKTPGTPTTTPVACAVETQSGVEITGGTFAGSVTNKGTITSGTFNGKVTNYLGRTISGGTFKGTVNNDYGTISGGTFAAGLSKNNGSKILGGIFNGNANLTGAYHVTVTDGSVSQVNGEGPLNADGTPGTAWDLYSYKDTTMTITADTEIFSLNGKSIGDGNCNSSYGVDKKTVTFTMPDDDVVLNGAITSTDLVMENGYPKDSNGGKNPCEGKGWTYSEKDISNLTGKLTLTSGTFDFSLANPQDTTKTTSADSAVACAVETQSGVEITGGTFNGEVRNSGTIERGTFAGGVTNSGTIKNGTFACSVTNYSNIESKGTFNGTVENYGGTISSGTFKGTVQNWYGTISGGTFHEKVLNSNGEITGGTFAAGLSANHNTVTGGVFNGKTGLTDAHHVTVTDGSLLKVNGEDPLNADETTGTVTPGTAWDLYAYAGTTVTITADTEIFSLNGQPIAESSYGSDKTTVTFTMPDDDVVLNKAITSTDLVMENGWPKDSSGGKTPCKGDGWQYIPNDPTYGNMLLLTGSNQTGGLYDFSTIGDGSAVECNVFVGKPTAITGGEFNGKVFNNSGILGGTFHGEVENMGPGTIKDGTFKNSVENNGMIENGTFEGTVENNTNGTISGGTFAGSVSNNGGIFNGNTGLDEVTGLHSITWDAASSNAKIEKVNGVSADWKPYVVTSNATTKEVTITADTEIFSLNGQPIAESSYGVDKKTVTFTMPDDDVVLNGELITKPEPEPEPKPEPKPEPEPTTYTVTVIGGTIDGKTSVSAKENDTLTVVLDQNDIPDGMTFDLWSISSDKLSGDINVDYRAEAMTFQMPAEDVTIRAQYRSAEIIEDAAPSPLATAATIAVGGAAAGIVVWQGVSLGVDLYLANALPQGVPVPTDRRALALLLWETAGKPEVALPTLYGDIPTEEIELQKATRWAVQNGLMDAADKKDASFFDPDHYVTKMDVFGAWLRLKKLLGTT